MTEVRITYNSEKKKDYTLVLAVKNEDKFTDFVRNSGLDKLEDSELASALLSHAGEHIVSANFYKSCLRHNGPEGEAAMTYFHSNGQPSLEKRYKNETCTDGQNGEPSEREFDKDGNLKRQVYRTNGKKQDPDEGVPAVQKFSASTKQLIDAESYKKDKLVSKWSSKQCRDYTARFLKPTIKSSTPKI